MRFMSTWLAATLALAAAAAPAYAAERWEELPAYPAMPAAADSGYAPVNGIEMYYATYGAGEPILLIHGGLGHADVWGH